MLHDMMDALGAIIAGQYNYPILCAALRLKPDEWMPLRHMTEEELEELEHELYVQEEHPYTYEARLVDGVSEVRCRVLLRKAAHNPNEPVQSWEVNPDLLRNGWPVRSESRED